MDLENRMVLPFADDDVEMVTICEQCGHEYPVGAGCQVCFMARRREELAKQYAKAVTDDLLDAFDDIFGDSHSLKNQAD